MKNDRPRLVYRKQTRANLPFRNKQRSDRDRDGGWERVGQNRREFRGGPPQKHDLTESTLTSYVPVSPTHTGARYGHSGRLLLDTTQCPLRILSYSLRQRNRRRRPRPCSHPRPLTYTKTAVLWRRVHTKRKGEIPVLQSINVTNTETKTLFSYLRPL